MGLRLVKSAESCFYAEIYFKDVAGESWWVDRFDVRLDMSDSEIAKLVRKAIEGGGFDGAA